MTFSERVQPLSLRPGILAAGPGGPDDEPLDVVDAADVPIGWQWRSRAYESGSSDYRVACAFLVRGDGAIWIPVRSRSKKLFPGAVDYSAAGHVRAGEGYAAAIRRELSEETGLRVSDVTVTDLGRIGPPHVTLHMGLFRLDVHTSAAPRVDPGEHMSAEWLSPHALRHQLASGRPAKPDLLTVVHRVFPRLL